MRLLTLRNRDAAEHSYRVTEYALTMGSLLNFSVNELTHLRLGAMVHDLGKIGISDQIIHKAGPLTEEEWKIMRLHPVYGYQLLSPFPYFRSSAAIPLYHHEKWDGSGYPRGLKGEEIPLQARIFAFADVWDALKSPRPYRTAWTDEAAAMYIREQSGKHFDPGVVDVFFACISAVDRTELVKASHERVSAAFMDKVCLDPMGLLEKE